MTQCFALLDTDMVRAAGRSGEPGSGLSHGDTTAQVAGQMGR